MGCFVKSPSITVHIHPGIDPSVFSVFYSPYLPVSVIISVFSTFSVSGSCSTIEDIYTGVHFIRKVNSTTYAYHLYVLYVCLYWGWKLPSPCFCRQYCLLGDDGWSVLLGRDVWQSRSQTVPPHLHVHKWFLCLPVIVRPGIWRLPRVPYCCRLWVSLIKWRSLSWPPHIYMHIQDTAIYKVFKKIPKIFL